jgi:hypothetical protein
MLDWAFVDAAHPNVRHDMFDARSRTTEAPNYGFLVCFFSNI